MKATPDKLPESADAHQTVREFSVAFTPRTRWSQAIVVVVFAAIFSLALFFFSLFVAVGAALVALTIMIGMLRSLAKGPRRSGRRIDENASGVIDTERSPDDGIYRPRDSSKP